MSFYYTQDAIRLKYKTVTRRMGWQFLKPGDILNACVQCQGLKKGQKIERICQIRVVSVQRTPLNTITLNDVEREGFVGLSPFEFIDSFCYANNCTPETKITRIEFKYI